MKTTVYINNEIIKTQGKKYFCYHGKRLLINDYLDGKNLKNNPSVTNNAGDININDTEDISIINKGVPLSELTELTENPESLFHGSKISYNKDGSLTLTNSHEPHSHIAHIGNSHVATEKIKSAGRVDPTEGKPVFDSPSEARINPMDNLPETLNLKPDLSHIGNNSHIGNSDIATNLLPEKLSGSVASGYSLLDYLIPIGLIGGGLLMNKKDENSNAYKGAQIREKGIAGFKISGKEDW